MPVRSWSPPPTVPYSPSHVVFSTARSPEETKKALWQVGTCSIPCSSTGTVHQFLIGPARPARLIPSLPCQPHHSLSCPRQSICQLPMRTRSSVICPWTLIKWTRKFASINKFFIIFIYVINISKSNFCIVYFFDANFFNVI